MSDLDKLFSAALKKPHASAVTETGAVVDLEPTTDEATPVTQVTTPAPVPEGKAFHLWDDANPRVISFFQIRMPEPLKRKIEWLASRQPGGGSGKQHKITLAALEREIDRLVAKELKDAKAK